MVNNDYLTGAPLPDPRNRRAETNGTGRNMKQPFSGLQVVQTDVATYALFLPTGQQIGLLMLPPNKQYIKDAHTLAAICRPLASRWSNP